MQRFFGVAQDITGNAIPSVTITVNKTGTATLGTLFSDNGTTPLANPFTSNTDGTYQFYAPNDTYDVVLTKTGYTFTASETTGVTLYDALTVISTTPVTVANTGAETDVFTMTVPAGYLGTNRGFHVQLFGRITNTSGFQSLYELRHYYGGVELVPLSKAFTGTGYTATINDPIQDAGFIIDAWVTANNSATAQNATMSHRQYFANSGSNIGSQAYTGTVNSAASQTYKISFDWQVGSTTRSVTITNAMVTSLP